MAPQFPVTAQSDPHCEGRNGPPEQLKEIETHFREHADAVIKQGEASVAAAKKAVPDYEKTIPTVMVMKELPQPRDAFCSSGDSTISQATSHARRAEVAAAAARGGLR